LGVSYSNGLSSVKNQFDFSNTEILSRTVIRFLQVYYSIDMDLPARPCDLFDKSVSWESIGKQISGHVSPMYISTITYGRMALFTMESSYSSTQVHNALQASFKAIDTNVDLEMGYRQVLANSSIKATIIGGSGSTAVLAVNGFDGLKEWITQGGNYNKDTPGAPLAYKLRYVCDNATGRIVMANDYFIKTCDELVDGRYGVKNSGGYVARLFVNYDLDGQTVSWESGTFSIGMKKAVDVPAKATNIVVHAQEHTGFWWESIFRKTFDKPSVICWNVYGTTLAPKYEEIACDF